MKIEETTPVLVGAGQVIQRKADLKTALGPIDMMVEAAKLAVADAGLGPDAFAQVDSVRMVEVLSGIYEDHVEVLTRRLGIEVRDRIYTETGGNSPQIVGDSPAESRARGHVAFGLL